MMRYRLLGKSGLRVSELCLGTMTFGEDWGFGASRAECQSIFDAYREAGGNFIDTASNYTSGQSEAIVGELIASDRDRFVVSTKYSLTTQPDDLNAGGNHRKCMRRAVKQSLERLRTDHIDVLWVHVWDGLTPADEVMRALDDLVRAGDVLHVGVSDSPAWVVSRSNMLAELRGWSSFVGLQAEYSLIERSAERELLPMAHALGIAVLAWAPLGAGILTGKYQRDGDDVRVHDSLRAERNEDRLSERALQIAETLTKLAASLDRPAAQLALAWLRQRPQGVIPVLGVRSAAQLRQNLGYLGLTLDAAAISALDTASAIDLGFPHAFLASELLQRATFGDLHELLEKHP
jgi:aryl-alcohol dehydrogenase-like predicted oxidoreductase